MTTLDVVAGAVGGHRAPGAVVAVASAGEAPTVVAVNGDPDTLYDIGSVTKVMTATLVLQHVARGDLALDDPVADHVPDFRLDPPEATRSVTVRHLLSHTSGIDRADGFADTGDGDDAVARYVAEVVAGAPLLHPPGERWSYCNAGYTVLGRLVEALDGRAWDDVLAERVFAPAGMGATTIAHLDRLDPDRRVATGHRYDPDRGGIVVETRRVPRSVGPAGNVLATAGDLVAFAEALTGGQGLLLDPDAAAGMLVPQVETRNGHQGLGWALPASGMAAHGGSTPGGTALLGTAPGVGTIAVVADGPGAAAIGGAVLAHVFGLPAEPAPTAPGTGPDLDPEACAGRYERYWVTQDIAVDGDGSLVATTTFDPALGDLFPSHAPVALTPIGGGRYTSQRAFEDFPTVWDFSEPGADGRPRLLMVDRLCVRAGA
jgi:CubicO group peptidase (beta-lactamase class C family)